MTAETIAAAKPQHAPVLPTEPVEAGKGGEGGDFQITNAEFIAAVFTDLPEGAFAAVCSKTGDPSLGGWLASRADQVANSLAAENNNYLGCSSFYPGDDGSFKARKAQFSACHFLMLDDLGTKVPLDRLGGFELSWLIETSPGNHQSGIILAEPITDGAVAVRLLNAVIDSGLCDAGATGPLSRWARLPVAINGKPKLPGDAVAAMTLAAIAIPEQLATARLVAMPPMSGLFAFAAGSLAFAAFGANRFMSVGADSTIAPIMAVTLAGVAATGTAHYAGMVAVLALLIGVVLLLASPLRLGWIADLLSIPVTTGFLAGISAHIIVGQLPAILGIDAPSGPLIGRLAEIMRQLPYANPYTAAIALGVLVVSLVAEWLSARIPGALIGLAASGLAVWQLNLERHGISVLGALPIAPPAITLIWPSWSEFTRLLPLALIVAVVCMMQTAAVVQSFPSDPNRPDNVSRDFAAVGAGSILAALLGAFAVNSSPPRTAVVAESGGQSQLSGLLAIAIVAALVLLAADMFAVVPQAALSGVLVFIGMRIFRVALMRRIYQRSPREILLVAASAALVVMLPIETGVTMSIVLSLLHSIYIIARPYCTELARVPGTTIWWTLGKGEAGEHEPGVLVFALGAPINFINANYLRGKLMDAVTEKGHQCRLVVIEANGVIDVDFTGSQIMQQAVDELHRRNVDVAMARLESERAKEAAARTGLIDTLGANRVFLSVDEAIRGCRFPTARRRRSTAGAPLIGVQNLLRMNCQQSSLARIRRDVSLRAESFRFMRFSGVGRRSS